MTVRKNSKSDTQKEVNFEILNTKLLEANLKLTEYFLLQTIQSVPVRYIFIYTHVEQKNEEE